MKQITEDFVSYEIAKLLKEKGFDSNMYTCYTDCEFPEFLTMIDYVVQGEEYERSNFESHNLIQAPTYQMALKWLREVHKIFIEPFVAIDLNGEYHYCFRLLNSICKDILEPKDLVRIGFKDTYEEAVEVALLYVLKNLI